MAEDTGVSALLNLVIYEWTEIDLKSMQTWLDEESVKVHDWKESSVNNREALKLKNKEWRGLPKKERLSMRSIGAVMRKYQTHIDELTTRCSKLDAGFLKLYNAFKQAPDPINALQSANKELQKRRKMKTELEQANSNLEQMQKEFSGLKNQSVTIRDLEDQLRNIKDTLQSDIERGIEKERKMFEDQKEELISNNRDRERELKMQIQSQKGELRQSQKRLSDAQARLLEYSLDQKENQTMKETDKQVLEEDIERLTAQVATLTREKQEFREKIKALETNVVDVSEMEALQEMVADSEKRLKRVESSLSAQVAANEEVIKERDRMVADLEKKIRQLRKEASIQPSPKLKPQTESVDAAAVLRQKRDLEERCSKMSLELQKKEGEMGRLKIDVNILKDQIEKQKKLISRLEDDLAKQLSSSTTKSRRGRSGLIGILGEAKSEEPTMTSDPFQVVCGQRDRFKERIHQLELDLTSMTGKLERSSNEKNSLYRENRQLFKKIKFLESYNAQSNPGDKVRKRNVEDAELGSVEKKYSEIYLESTNPWTDFQKRVQYQRESELSFWEKITLQVSSVVVSRGAFRKCTFFYAVALHLLVFLALYFRTSSTLYCPEPQDHEPNPSEMALSLGVTPPEESQFKLLVTEVT